MHIANGTWVLVADGERFLMLRNQGDAERLDLRVVEHAEVDNPPTREQGTDRPGRLSDAAPGRSAVEVTDWHALEKARFAADMADRLRRWALDGRFDRLVVVADPRTLGELRAGYHKAVAERLTGEVDKDLTQFPVEKIERVLLSA